jgi:hypothetical protein
MARGRTAPLSPNEEVSLRRVALGISRPEDLPARDIRRLKTFSLIEEHGAGLRLTSLGRERCSPFQTAVPSMRLAPRTSSFPRWPSS